MLIAMLSWLLAIPLLGLTTGLRAMTPMAVLGWFAYRGYLPVDGTWAAWMGRLPVVIAFTVLAASEMIADKLPRMPDRISAAPLLARLILGGLIGSIAATAMAGPGLEGVLLGVLGAALGACAGFMIRRDVVQRIGCADWKVALAEDLIAVAYASFAMHVVTN
jgi:uncharacterized membrane protein